MNVSDLNTSELSIIAISAVTPFLIQANRPLAEAAGRDLWELINQPFEKEPRDKEKIDLLKKYPDEKEIRDQARTALETALENQPEMEKRLREHLAGIPEIKEIDAWSMTKKQRQKKNPKQKDYSGKPVDPENRRDRPHAD